MLIEGNAAGLACDVDASTDTKDVRVTVRGSGNVLSIGPGCRLTLRVFLADGARLSIGAKVTTTGQLTIIAHEGALVTIDDNCLFSQNIVMRPSDVHKIFDAATGVRLNEPAPIRIGAGVWVGEQVMFLKGSSVAAGSVVGARSVVTGVFDEPGVVIAGHPARIRRRGIRWAP